MLKINSLVRAQPLLFYKQCKVLFSFHVYLNIGFSVYSGTSLLRSPMGLGKSDHNGEVTLLQGVICSVEYNLGLSHSDCNGEVFLLVR